MRLLRLTTQILFIFFLLIIVMLLRLNDPPDHYPPAPTTLRVYDAKGDIAEIHYVINQPSVSNVVDYEVRLVITDFMREASCKDDMWHDLGIAVSLHFGVHVPMIIQVNCWPT